MSEPGDRSATARSSPRSKRVSADAGAPAGPVVDVAVARTGQLRRVSLEFPWYSIMQKHHYLPRFYQRRWAAADGRVFVYQRPHDRLIVSQKPTKATGWIAGLYNTVGVPLKRANSLEDEFWKRIDQWGSDGIEALESNDPEKMRTLNKEQWSIFLLSLLIRNPIEIERINGLVANYYAEDFPDFANRYGFLRKDYEPETFVDFMELFQKPGVVELGAEALRKCVLNEDIKQQLLNMHWDVVSVADPPGPILTSDNPVILYRGLKQDDGLLMLPLGPNKFFVAHNHGQKDLLTEIVQNVKHGHFVEFMNKIVVENAINYVYSSSAGQLDFVESYLKRKSEDGGALSSA